MRVSDTYSERPMDAESLDVTSGTTMARGLRPWHLGLALVPGVIFMGTFIWSSCGDLQLTGCTLFDDAMISMAYGKTWATTGELVWYPGAARVQGFTNPLWTAFMTVLHLMGLSGPGAALAVSFFGLVLLLATGWLVGLVVLQGLAGAPHGRVILACVAAGTTPFLYPLSFWTLRGMEVGALAFLSLLIIALLQRMLSQPATEANRLPMMLIGVATMTGCLLRLDFLAIAVPLMFVGWANLPSRGARRQFSIFVALPTTLTMLLVLGGQFIYYGDALPNTYRLKVEGIDLSLRLTRGALSALKLTSLLLVTGVAGLVIWQRGTSIAKRTSATCGAVILGCLAYCVWAGGDAWEWSRMLNRYLAVCLPAALALTVLGIGTYINHGQRLTVRVAAVTLAGLGVASLGHAILTDTREVSFRAWSIEVFAGALIATFLMVVASQSRTFGRTRVNATTAVFTGCLVVVSTGVVPLLLSIQGGPFLVGADRDITRRVQLAKESILPGSTVATVWAGAPGYYFGTDMVDLLGKSDRAIAATDPTPGVPFIPGHNKWNYDYSIGALRPDLVFLMWLAGDIDHSNLRLWGYEEKCLKDGSAVWVLMTSVQIRHGTLFECPRPS